VTLSIFAGFFLADAAVITGIFEKEKVASVSKRWAKFQDVLFYFQLSFPEVCKEAKKKKGEKNVWREREKKSPKPNSEYTILNETSTEGFLV
jgi:hypothetical protein